MKAKIIQNEEKPVPAEIIAESIRRIGEATKKMDSSGLNDKAIILLLSNYSGVNRTEVGNVLWALRNLDVAYLKKKSK